jgi:pyruvate-formate lyase-activating enzyme
MSITQRIKDKRKNISLNPVPPFPKVMMLEPSNACNHACIFCGNKKSNIKKKNIPIDLAKDILLQAAKLGVEEVGFYLRGEPFLHPHLPEMVRYAKEIGIGYVYLSTNGAVGDLDAYKAVLNAGLDSFKFSINAGNRDDFKKIHGKDDFEKVISRLSWLINFRRSQNMTFKIYVSSTFTPETKNAIYELRDSFSNIIDEYYIHGTCPIPGKNDLYPEYRFTIPCPMVFNRVHVSAEGYINACCFDFENALAIADLNQISLLEAWSCDTFIAVRKKHIAKDLSGIMCHQCITGNGSYDPLQKDLIFRRTYNAKIKSSTSC